MSGAESFDDFIDFFSSWTKTPIPKPSAARRRNCSCRAHCRMSTVFPTWTHGRIVLIGDAAPNDAGHGARSSQTFVDALAIRDAFAETDSAEEALFAFETSRHEVAKAVVKISQKGLFLGPYNVDPLAIRYQNEIEPLTA